MQAGSIVRAPVLFTLLAASALAGPIQDPAMAIDAGSLSDPITGSTVITPGPGGGGVFGFYNPTGSTITGLTFDVALLPNLSPQTISQNFFCNSAGTAARPNPFFLNCSIDYTPATGELLIDFSGVNPPDDTDPFDTEIGEHEGIPPLIPGCLAHPDSFGCNIVGHFLLILNDGFVKTDSNGNPVDNGGWKSPGQPPVFPPGPVVIGVKTIVTTSGTTGGGGNGGGDNGGGDNGNPSSVPEPATLTLSSAAVLAMLAARIRRRARA